MNALLHSAKPAARRAIIYAVASVALLVLGAAYVTDGFQRFDWPSFHHWAAGEKS